MPEQPSINLETQSQSQMDESKQASENQSSTLTEPATSPSPTTTLEVKPNTLSGTNSFVYASFIKRFLAVLIDGIVLFPVMLVIQFVFMFVSVQTMDTSAMDQQALESALGTTSSIGSIIVSAVSLLYTVGFLATKSATPGKMVMKLIVVSETGEKASLIKVLLRETIGKLLSVVVFLLGYLWVIWDKKKQAWHDKIAGTVVIEKDSMPQM